MSNNTPNNNEFDIDSGGTSPVVFKYKPLVNTPGYGQRNSYQKVLLSKEQKLKIDNDKKILGGK